MSLITVIAASGVALDRTHDASSLIVGDHKANVFGLARGVPTDDHNVARECVDGGHKA
jgi:hypothetical protein